MELNAEFIGSLREVADHVIGDVDHTRPVLMENIRDDVLAVIPDTIITTVKLSYVVADLAREAWHLVGTRLVNEIECAEFMTLAPFALRIAVLGTDFCVDGEYIMFRESEQDDNPYPVLVRVGIQG